MASFLSFVYRRQSSAPASFDSSPTSSRRIASVEARLSLRNTTKSDKVVEDIACTDQDGHRSQFLPPGVSSSGSSESAWAPPHMSSHDESEDSSFVVHEEDDEDERFLSSPFTPEGLLPRKSVDSMRRDLKLDIPPRDLDQSMMMMTIQSNNCKSSPKKPNRGEFSGVAKILAGMDSDGPVIKSPSSRPTTGKSQNIYRDDEDYDEEDNMILPPPQYRLQQPSLQSKSTFTASSIQSPPVSTSSFYSQQTCSNNDRPVAMSPVLQVGQARTAVGALVALREAANCHPNASIAMSSPKNQQQSEQKVATANNESSTASGLLKKNLQEMPKRHSFPMSVLPPRSKEMEHSQQQGEVDPMQQDLSLLEVSGPGDENANVPFPSSSPSNAMIGRRRSDGIFNTASFEAGFEPSLPSRTGGTTQLHRYSTMPASGKQQQQQQTSSSPVSSKSSLISTGQQADDQLSVADKTSAAAGSLSLSEGIATFDKGDGEPIAYDDFEEEFDAALMARKFRNQKMRQQPQVMMDETFFEPQEDYDDEEAGDYVDHHQDEYIGEEDEYDEYYYHHHQEEQQSCFNPLLDDGDGIGFEDALMRRKARNQRQEKERFLHEVVARLRDNLDLVADTEAAASRTVAAMGSWFVKTPIDAENLLTGFSEARRNKLLSSIDSILNEMELAQPEEFIVSPSKVPVMAVSHDTLTQSLQFCRALIVSAIPRDEREKMVKELPCVGMDASQQQLFVWKSLPELNHALGIAAPPQTPATVRGGGTSLFSLPEESGAETPHTSNVSLATSITSVNTYNRQPATQSMRPQLILQQDGLQLRHTVEVVSSLLQKLSLVCMDLGELSANKQSAAMARQYVLTCDNIKQLYLRLLTVKKEDARALMETFYLESLSPHCGAMIAREVSADEEDLAETGTKAVQVAATNARVSTLCTGRFQGQQRGRTTFLVDRQVSSMSFGPPPAPMPSPRRHTIPVDRQSDQPRVSRGMSLFSPSTEDMRSKASDCSSIPYEMDDLRRQVGSYDRDDSDDTEERDGPCEDGFETREDAEDWRVMYQNVSLAASSLRSLGNQSKSSIR